MKNRNIFTLLVLMFIRVPTLHAQELIGFHLLYIRITLLIFLCVFSLSSTANEEDIKRIKHTQKSLLILGYKPDLIDGIVGEATRSAVRKFQVDNDIPEFPLGNDGRIEGNEFGTTILSRIMDYSGIKNIDMRHYINVIAKKNVMYMSFRNSQSVHLLQFDQGGEIYALVLPNGFGSESVQKLEKYGYWEVKVNKRNQPTLLCITREMLSKCYSGSNAEKGIDLYQESLVRITNGQTSPLEFTRILVPSAFFHSSKRIEELNLKVRFQKLQQKKNNREIRYRSLATLATIFSSMGNSRGSGSVSCSSSEIVMNGRCEPVRNLGTRNVYR